MRNGMTSSIMLFLIQVRPHPGKLLKYMINFFLSIKKFHWSVYLYLWISEYLNMYMWETEKDIYFSFFGNLVFIIYIYLLSHHINTHTHWLTLLKELIAFCLQLSAVFSCFRSHHRMRLKSWRPRTTGWRRRRGTSRSPRGPRPSPPAAPPPPPLASR